METSTIMKKTHLILGVYTQDDITACWANLEQGDLLLEGVICTVKPLWRILDEDVRIIRPKKLSIFTNDKQLVANFTPPMNIPFQMDILAQLFRYDEWKLYYQDGDKLPKAKELWTLYRQKDTNYLS